MAKLWAYNDGLSYDDYDEDTGYFRSNIHKIVLSIEDFLLASYRAGATKAYLSMEDAKVLKDIGTYLPLGIMLKPDMLIYRYFPRDGKPYVRSMDVYIADA